MRFLAFLVIWKFNKNESNICRSYPVQTDFDISIQFRNEIFNFRSLCFFPAVVFLFTMDFDFIQLNSFPFMTNILHTLCDEKIYTRLSLLERFPPPLSLISSFLQGSVLKQNTSLMQKIRNSCFSCFSTRFQAVLDSNRPIYIAIIKIYAKHVEAKQNYANKFHLTT